MLLFLHIELISIAVVCGSYGSIVFSVVTKFVCLLLSTVATTQLKVKFLTAAGKSSRDRTKQLIRVRNYKKINTDNFHGKTFTIEQQRFDLLVEVMS